MKNVFPLLIIYCILGEKRCVEEYTMYAENELMMTESLSEAKGRKITHFNGFSLYGIFMERDVSIPYFVLYISTF